MRNLIVATSVILLVGLVPARVCKAGSIQERRRITISFNPSATQLTLHEPVILNLRIHNDLSRTIKVNLGKDFKQNFLISVKRPDGSVFHAPQMLREGIGLIGVTSINPGQTYNQRILLNEWIDFNAQGRYEVEVRLAGIGQDNALVTGNKVTFDITPKDTTKLEKVCGSFAKDIDAATSYERAAEAARILSYVRDPVAVPYLERALRSGRLVEQLAIEGLEQIGNKEAVQALISSLKIRSGYTAILARSALERLEQRTQDPNIKVMIKHALSG